MALKRELFLALSIILIIVSVVTTSKLRDKITLQKKYQADLNELNHIKYGLLNAHEWKRQVSDVLGKNLEGLSLESVDTAELRGEIIKVLERLFVEVNKILEKKKSEGFWVESMLRSLILEFALDMNELRNEIPGLADAIIDELDSEQSIERLKEFLEGKIFTMVEESIGIEDTSVRDNIVAKNNCFSIANCQEYLKEKIHQNNRKTNLLATWTLLSLLSIFLLWYLLRDGLYRQWQWYALFIALLLLLYGGLSLPMINIDARIDSLDIEFMQKQISFEDQMLFFQSKSILEVVQILMKNGDLQTIMVGVLILLFSIIFPLLKMTSVLVLKLNRNLRKHHWIDFMAYKTGKWSMADVFVVAIFMAFIGFRGILSSQLDQLNHAVTRAEIITTDQSNLQVGILFFTAFVILGILFSSLTKKSIANETESALSEDRLLES